MTSHTYQVTVIPRSSKSGVVDQTATTLKVRVKASPLKGKANEELRACLAKTFNVPKSRINILKGLTSRKKLVIIDFT